MSGTIVSLIGFAGWSVPGAIAQSPEGASLVPCAAPLLWRIARIDREFGLAVPEATEAVQHAVDLWEEVSGRELFRPDENNGFPIRFVFDERQERTQERVRRQEEIAREKSSLMVQDIDISRQLERLREKQQQHSEQTEEYQERVKAYNAQVRGWNERGGAPAGVERELRVVAKVLQHELRQLESENRAREEEEAIVQQRAQRLNRGLHEHERHVERVALDFPPVPVESGVYREAVRRDAAGVISVSREVRVYRFQDSEELQLVLAHELGHALGLAHSLEPSAVMNSSHDKGKRSIRTGMIHPDDVNLFANTCPNLVMDRR